MWASQTFNFYSGLDLMQTTAMRAGPWTEIFSRCKPLTQITCTGLKKKERKKEKVKQIEITRYN